MIRRSNSFVQPTPTFKTIDVYLYSFDGVELTKEFGCLRIYSKSTKTAFRPRKADGSISESLTKIVSTEEGKVYSRFVWFKDPNTVDKAIKLFIEKYKADAEVARNKLERCKDGIEALEYLLNQ